jgi:hypothetical protein
MNNPVRSGRLGGTLFALPNDVRVFRCSVTGSCKEHGKSGCFAWPIPHELRLPLRNWNRNCRRLAFITSASGGRLGCPFWLVESARFAPCVYGINSSRRDIFHLCHRRVNRGQAAHDSKTDRLGTVIGAVPSRRPLRREPLRGNRKIISRRGAIGWDRRRDRSIRWLRNPETRGEQSAHQGYLRGYLRRRSRDRSGVFRCLALVKLFRRTQALRISSSRPAS